MKRCTKCGVEKALTDFHIDRRKPSGRCTWCKVCVNARRKARYDADIDAARARQRELRAAHPGRHLHYSRRHRLGITATQAEIEALAAAQGHRCAICKRHESEFTQSLHLDHDHRSGDIRAFLCGPCNRGIGYLGDDAERVQAAADYLASFKTKE